MFKELNSNKNHTFKHVIMRISNFKALAVDSNKELFLKWNGNCCRQAAFIAKVTLDEKMPDFEWSMWEAEFEYNKAFKVENTDKSLSGKFDHAWVFGKNNKTKERIIVDATGIIGTEDDEDFPIIQSVSNNAIPYNEYDYLREYNLKEISRKKISFEQMREEKEYFTGLKGYDLMNKLIELEMSFIKITKECLDYNVLEPEHEVILNKIYSAFQLPKEAFNKDKGDNK